MGYYNKELDEIDFQIIEAKEILKPYIHSFWAVKKEKIDSALIHKILSDGSMGITINFKAPYSIKVNGNNHLCTKPFIINGVTKHPSYMRFEKELELIGVRFTPAGAFVFFEENIDGFVDKHPDLSTTYNWKLEQLYQELKSKETVEDKIALFEEYLIQKLTSSKKKNSPWIFNLIENIHQKKGDTDIFSICHQFNISLRQVERKFKQEVGLSPKVYARIIRLRTVKDTMSSLEVQDLTTAAYDTGFFDQAHFTKEFKIFMKETPKNYYQNKLSAIKLCNYKKYKL